VFVAIALAPALLVSAVPPVCNPAAKLLAPPPPLRATVQVELPATATAPAFRTVETVPERAVMVDSV
jgi:hypothetical protein